MTLLATADRAQESALNIGASSPITLLGALDERYVAFPDSLDGDTIPYTIEHRDSGQWEVGYGVFDATLRTLTRLVVLSNSLGTTALVAFNAGVVDCWIDAPAEKLVLLDADSNDLHLPGALTVADDTHVLGDLDIEGDSLLEGTMTVGGISTLHGALTVLSTGLFSGALTVNATGSVFSAGGDASTDVAVGAGGASPTGIRTASLSLNAPDSGSFRGAAKMLFKRAATLLWSVGLASSVAGAMTTVTDHAWDPGTGTPVAALSSAGALKISAGLTATTGTFSGAVSMTALTATTGGFSGAVSMAGLTATTGSFSSTLAAAGDFAVNTNKFTVTAASGNTTVAGALGVTGAVTLTVALTTANGGTGNTTYAAGDINYYASGTAFTKLAIGTAGQVLRSTGTAPAWSTATTPATATSGDLMYASATNVWSGLAIGSANTMLVSTGSFPAWTAGPTISSGTDASTTITFGTGGGSPTGVRGVTVNLNAPSSGSFVGAGYLQFSRTSAAVGYFGIDNTTNGAASANTDFKFQSSAGTNVAAISQAGALKLAAGLTATTGVFSSTISFTGATFTTSLISNTAVAFGSVAATNMSLGATTVYGATVLGFGTTADASLLNRSAGAAFYVVANTVNVQAMGTVTSAGLITGSAGATINGLFSLPTTNQIHQLVGHNFVQGDATNTYMYGGTAGWHVRKSDNSISLFDITDAGAGTLAGALAITGAFTGATTGAFSGALTVSATGSSFTAGTDATTQVTIGSGGAAATANRFALLNLSVPTAGGFPGYAYVSLQRNNVGVWAVGIQALISGAMVSAADFVWQNSSGTNVAAMAPTGSLVTAGALTITGALAGVTTLATSGTINSQTISSTAAFTGTMSIAGLATMASGGRFTGNSAAASGGGLEVGYGLFAGTTGHVVAFDRSGGLYLPLQISGSVITLTPSTGAIALNGPVTANSTFGITGAVTLSSTLTMTGALSITAGLIQLADGYAVQWINANNRIFHNGTNLLFDTGGSTRLTIADAGGSTFSGLLTVSAGITIAAGQDLKLGNAYVAGVVAATGTVILKDSTGTAYRVSCAV